MDSSSLEAFVNRFTTRRTNLPAICDLASSWYLGWYLHLRLDEEILRSKRYGFEMSVIYVTLEHVPDDLQSAERQTLTTTSPPSPKISCDKLTYPARWVMTTWQSACPRPALKAPQP